MKALIIGGSGFVGSNLARFLVDRGFDVSILARNPDKGLPVPSSVSKIAADSMKTGPWQAEITNFEVIINLAGVTVFHRWDESYKSLLRDSRILTTRNVVDSIPSNHTKKITLINASGAGFYGLTQDQKLDETASSGSDYLAKLAFDWEDAAKKAEEKGVRVVRIRIGIVLGQDGGALHQMTLPFKFFIGGKIGDGKQWISWIHINDICRATHFVIEKSEINGPINFTAPNPVRNVELSKAISKIMKRPALVSAPSFMIRMILGEFSAYVLKGQRVIPKALLDNGFTFDFPTIEQALENLL